MPRLPFNPDEMRGPERTEPMVPRGAPDDAIGVRDLAERIDRALRDGLPTRICVVGEISGFTDRTHWYFSLKDEEAVVSCVMFAAAARRADFAPENGQAVVARGRIEFYARQGRTQLYVERLEPLGAGDLDARFRALCAELKDLGWFDPQRKRPLPRFPRRVAIVTSRTGAALQDVLKTMATRCATVDAALVDAKVQGAAAAPGIAKALDWLSAHHETLGIDAVILTRGGGSMEDLWAFNEREVGEAVLRCAVPVVAAIGHETDTTIAELVADERASTPTQAAMRLTPDRVALAEQIDQLGARARAALARRWKEDRRFIESAPRRLALGLRHALADRRHRLERQGTRLARNRPEALYAARRSRVERLESRLRHAIGQRVAAFDPEAARRELDRSMRRLHRSRTERLDSLEREMIVVGPMHVLARGYSVTTDDAGRAVRSARDVKEGQAIETRVADGAFRSTVGESRQAPGQAPSPLPPRRRRRKASDPDQMGLF